MVEMILAGLLSILNSAWFTPLLVWVLGMATGQLPLVQRIWGYVMGARKSMDKVEELIDLIDATLKANNIIPPDAPKMEVAQVKAMLAGKVSAEDLAKGHALKMAGVKRV